MATTTPHVVTVYPPTTHSELVTITGPPEYTTSTLPPYWYKPEETSSLTGVSHETNAGYETDVSYETDVATVVPSATETHYPAIVTSVISRPATDESSTNSPQEPSSTVVPGSGAFVVGAPSLCVVGLGALAVLLF